MIVVDAANVIGSSPTGWWRDRPGAAASFVATVRSAVEAGRLDDEVVIVLEGQFLRGAPAEGGGIGRVSVLHAAGEGDDTIAAIAAQQPGAVVVTADRQLGERVRAAGGSVVGPRWLLARLGP